MPYWSAIVLWAEPWSPSCFKFEAPGLVNDPATVEEVLSVPPDLLQRLGLLQALGMMRMRGLQAILFSIRDQVRRATERSADA